MKNRGWKNKRHWRKTQGIGVMFILGGAGDMNAEVMGNELRMEDG